MSLHRFFLTAKLATDRTPVTAPLSAEDLHHARDVLRIAPPEEIELVAPDGTGWRVRVEGFGAATVAGGEGAAAQGRLAAANGSASVGGGVAGGLSVTPLAPLETASAATAPQLALVQGVAKGEKMDLIVRQATELGVETILPVLTSRSVVRLDDRRRAEKGARWRRVAKAAAEQSHRDRLPEVADPLDLSAALVVIATYNLVLVLWEEAAAPACDIVSAIAQRELLAGARVALVVGPEGGLSADEVTALVDAGAVAVTLGRGILRTETAAVVGVALTAYALGGLGAS